MLDILLKSGILFSLTTFIGIKKHLNNDEITISSQQQQQQIPIQKYVLNILGIINRIMHDVKPFYVKHFV